MGYKSSFLDNEIYGAEDVSRVFSHLVSNGTILYPEAETVLESLDTMTAEFTNEGVSEYGGLEVVKTDTGVIIEKGAGFFESGVCVEVDAEGVELEVDEEAEVYVYFIYEREFNRVRASVSTSIPEGDVIMLAQITADGNIIDMRNYASCKIVPNTSNYYHDFSITHQKFGDPFDREESNTTYYEMPHGGFHYLLLQNAVATDFTLSPLGHIIDLTLEGEQSIRLNRDATPIHMHVLKTGNTLRIATTRTNKAMDEHTVYLTLA